MVTTYTKDTIPWRLRDTRPTSDGALTDDQMLRLGQKFGFDLAAMRELSQKIDIGLSKELSMTQLELRPIKIAKGVADLRAVIKTLVAAELKLSKAGEKLQHLKIGAPSGQNLESFVSSCRAITQFRKNLEIYERHSWVTYIGNPDKRRTKDVRRSIVCTGIFNVWDEGGRNLSYSTDPETSERGGRLVEFVNAVVECITDPPSRLRGEAIKVELDEFKAWPSMTPEQRCGLG
jgi:hypothetical protein